MSLPRSLVANPRLTTWLSFDAPGLVSVRVGKVELGQGIATAMASIAAFELDLALEQVRMVPASTSAGPNEGTTAGSMSVQESGASLRQVCAEARAVLVAAASAKLSGDVAVLHGTLTTASGESLTYWDLDTASLLDREAEGLVRPKVPEPVGSPARVDLPDKVFGRPRYVHDLRLPGQLYGRVVRLPTVGAVLTSVDESVMESLPDVVVVRDGSFLGVVAAREEVAVEAASLLAASAQWDRPVPLPEEAALPEWVRAEAAESSIVHEVSGSPTGVVVEHRATYSRPYIAHASIAPSCGVAQWTGTSVQVWSHSQGVHALRGAIAQALAMPLSDVSVQHVEGAGCYGHNPADDAAFDAVLLARAVPGRPVQAMWSRADELGAGPFGPAMVADLTAGLDESGRVVSWRHDTFSQGHTARPGYAGTPGLLASAAITGGAPLAPASDPGLPSGGSLRNSVPIYDFPVQQVVSHRSFAVAPRASAMRSLGAHLNVFAIESFMDELALRANADPVEFRLAQLSDPRARAVLERAAELASWGSWTGEESTGHGIAMARYKGMGAYCAVVAEVEAVRSVRVRRLVITVDVGRVVSLDGVVNQIEGGAVQATSWTVLEQVRFSSAQVTSTDWETYPILRFSDVPDVVVDVLDHPELPSVGAGECAQGPTAAAIGNAVQNALGVSVRKLPLTPDNIVAALR